MKRILVCLLVVVISLNLAACGAASGAGSAAPKNEKPAVQESKAPESTPAPAEKT